MIIKDPLLKRIIEEYLTKPNIGDAIVDACNLIMRLRLGQLNIVVDILKKYCNLYQEGRGPGLDEPLYKALELGELLICLEKFKKCDKATNCWVTRKGFCAKLTKFKNPTEFEK